MHIFFSGIGGAGASSIALLAREAGYEVSGSDAKASATIDYLTKHGIKDIHIGQTQDAIEKVHQAKPIDLFVFTSALPMTDPNHPELEFCKTARIPTLKHDEFLAKFVTDKDLKMVAVAGTHGKSTTTAMLVWLADELKIPASWSVGAKMDFAETGHYQEGARYFICEADEFDRKFLSFYPELAVITGVDWDHPDIYPTRESYVEAFTEFLGQSDSALLWQADAERLALEADAKFKILDGDDAAIDKGSQLAGRVNRMDGWLAAQAFAQLSLADFEKCLEILNRFPGLGRRFEMIAPHIYSDYAHTPAKIRGALQMAHEVASDNVVVVYEGLHNTRQHFIAGELEHLFDGVKKLYVVPSYLAREDPNLPLLKPDDLLNMLSNEAKAHADPAKLDEDLLNKIKAHADSGDLVLALSAGGADSLDEWLRKEFKNE